MKFNHGCKVTCTIFGEKITDAKISINEDGTPYICHNNEKFQGDSANDKLGYQYSWATKRDFIDDDVTDLKLADGWNVGDIIVDENNNKNKILARLESLVFLSYSSDHNSYLRTTTKDELIAEGYKPKQTEEVIELTLEDVAKLKGVHVSMIKIKK
jgi:hypothetical protein